MSATSRACRACRLWKTTRHTNIRAALAYTAAQLDCRPTNQPLSVWQLHGQGKSPDTTDTRDILVASSRSRMSGVSARMPYARGCYGETVSVEFTARRCANAVYVLVLLMLSVAPNIDNTYPNFFIGYRSITRECRDRLVTMA